MIGRLNVGGPGLQAITLSAELDRRGFETLLLRGHEDDREGTLDALAERLGVRPVRLPTGGRELSPRDLPALLALVRILRRVRPDVVHTHAAKAGALGRLAALAVRPRPVVVHTYHGHSLTGYFPGPRARLFLAVERSLARVTDRLVAVSEEVRDELLALGVGPPQRYRVVRLGFDLAPFCDERRRGAARAALRAELGVEADRPVVTLVARLVPVKRVDRFLRIAARVRTAGVVFAVAGDGELAEALRASPDAAAVRWLGLRDDVADLCLASDVVVLTSDREGTPVSLIEAQAAAAPVVSTRVGGTASVVCDGKTGYLVDVDDEQGFAERVERLLADPGLRAAMGRAGREHAVGAFRLERLVEEVDGLYREALAGR